MESGSEDVPNNQWTLVLLALLRPRCFSLCPNGLFKAEAAKNEYPVLKTELIS